MAKDNYDVVVEHTIGILKNTIGKHLVKASDGVYTFKNMGSGSLDTLEDFSVDLKKHLVSDTPLSLSWSEDGKFEEFYRKRFFEPFMQPFHYKKYKFPFYLGVDEFKKLIELFKCLAFDLSLSVFFPVHIKASLKSNPYHFEFTKEILSLDIKNDFSDSYTFWNTIRSETRTIELFYQNIKHPVLKEGLINFLKNKQEKIKEYSDIWQETLLIDDLKNILHSDDWAEIAGYLPVYSQAIQKNTNNGSLFSIGVNPIYYIDLNKSNLLNFSLTTITDNDIFVMMIAIIDSLNITRPAYIDKIELSDPMQPDDADDDSWKDIRLYLSGKNMNEVLVGKFMELLEKMIVSYNSSSIDKNTNLNSNTYERRKSNNEYLKKVAETCWLDFELGEASGKDKKVNKV